MLPVVGADNNGFMGQLIKGRAAGRGGHQPGRRRRRGHGLALDVLQGKNAAAQVTTLTPQVWDTDDGPDQLKAIYDPKLRADLQRRS